MANKLIDPEEVLNVARRQKNKKKGAAQLMLTLLNLNKVNQIYEENANKQGIEFISALLDAFGVNYEFSEDELNRIPRKGSFIVVANHPLGGVDSLLLLKLLLKVRSDFKFTGNILLDNAEPLSDYIISNPWGFRERSAGFMSSTKRALTHLSEGGCLGLFPSGEVSGFNYYMNEITDKPWRMQVLKFIRKAAVPVVPVFFQGTNSPLFYFLEFIHPSLRKFRLHSEVLNKKSKTIKIRIGNPMPLKDLIEFSDILRFGRYLRAKTYALGTSLEVKRFFDGRQDRLPEIEPVAPAADEISVKAEMSRLLADYLLLKSGDFSLVCAPSHAMPVMMNEIGRLREQTFRAVGEGTNQSLDLDEYDLYYHQLFIWDDVNQKIVGAYRIGKGKEIIGNYGIGGFYIQSLFRIDAKFSSVLSESIELGRSFIVEEYQRQPLPLFLLWKGILYFLLKNPEYRYLIGPVSISNKFSEFSKNAIVEFIKRYYFHHEFAKMVHPRCEFNFTGGSVDTDILLEKTNDLTKLDRLIEDIDPENNRLPVLLKKYLKLNGKIIAFNVDPLFNNCLDGLLLLDLFDVPVDTISSLSKELNDESIMTRFYGYGENPLRG